MNVAVHGKGLPVLLLCLGVGANETPVDAPPPSPSVTGGVKFPTFGGINFPTRQPSCNRVRAVAMLKMEELLVIRDLFNQGPNKSQIARSVNGGVTLCTIGGLKVYTC